MFFRKGARRALQIGIIALLAVGAVSLAQAQPVGQQTSVPQGSPLDPSLTGQAQTGSTPTPSSSSQSDTERGISGNGGQPYQPTALGPQSTSSPLSLDQLVQSRQRVLNESPRAKEPPAPGEFEDYVARVIGRKLPRFGQDLMLPSQRDFATPSTATVPPDYRLNIGDTIVLSLTGSVDGSFDREIDTNGNIFLPSIGVIHMVGVRYGDARDRISAAIGTKYRDYTVNVSIKSLRGIRVYVTGLANNPGAFTVSSLSTLANAVLQAGGPSSGGSFRSIKLYRDGAQVADFDLYELIRGGSRLNDAVLQNEDVLFIPPAGAQVAVIGSVQQEAIYELKPGETIQQLVVIAGGPNVLADTDRYLLYRTSEQADLGPRQVGRIDASGMVAIGGDILQLLSKGSLIQPTARQSILVRLEGEVNKPGNYYVAPNTPLRDVLNMAGGLTQRAFPFGAKLVRQTVREQQRISYLQAIDQLQQAIAASPLTGNFAASDAERAAQVAGGREILQQLRATEPDGRVVMDIPPEARDLPGGLVLENNDRILVPPVGTTVSVFGAVYRPASFLIEGGAPTKVYEYVDLAGGTQRYADKRNIILVRANGSVLSRKRGALHARVLPGDVVFVPVKTGGSSFWAKLREISTIVFQLGIAASVAATVGR